MDKVPVEKIENLISFWKEGSEQAYNSAKEILEKTSQFSTVLFQLHLSLEKALKSKIVAKTSEYAPYSHNLVFLFSKLELLAKKENFEALARVSQYNLSIRYPEDKRVLVALSNKDLATAELIAAKDLLTWISSL